MKFMNLPDEYSGEQSYFSIIPVAFENNVTSGEGASKGPVEIIKASKQLEYYDEQFDNEPFTKGIRVLDIVESESHEEMIDKVSRAISVKGSFPIFIGGDHSITLGSVNGLKKTGEFGVVVFDAHSDMRDMWNGSKLNHACVSKNLSKNHKVLIVGVRSQDIEERREIDESKDVNQILTHGFSIESLRKALKDLPEKIYISIDVDVFDPSFIRNTGTPEPGGLGWHDVVNSLVEIFNQKKVVGADIVEFAPVANYEAEAYSLAKLCYKIMALNMAKN